MMDPIKKAEYNKKYSEKNKEKNKEKRSEQNKIYYIKKKAQMKAKLERLEELEKKMKAFEV